MKKSRWISGLLILLFSSCQKVVQLDLNNAASQIVIQGEVTDDRGPYQIIINQTVGFYADNTFPGVSGATVIITDDLGDTDSLSEKSPGIYQTHFLKGKPGITYTLTVLSQNVKYAAVSTMPQPVRFDSLTLEETSGFGQERINAIVNFQDPPNVKNFYQFTETVNNKSFPRNNFVLSDRLSDGKYISTTLRTDSSYIFPGDTVKVNMFSIDENTYTYFLELRQSSGTGAFNSTASPANPTTNITGGALGYFSAHTVQTRAIVVN